MNLHRTLHTACADIRLEPYSRSDSDARADRRETPEAPEVEGLLDGPPQSPRVPRSADGAVATDNVEDSEQRPEGGRLVKHPTSYAETMMHFLKANIGSGMLAMGDAFKNGGLAASPFLIFFLGFLGVFCQHQLMNASKATARRLGLRSHPDFCDTVRLSFADGPPLFKRSAKTVSRLVNFFLVLIQLEYCCIYFVFISTNLKKVLDQYIPPIDAHIYMAIIFLPILLLSWVRNLKYLAPVSLVSNVVMCTGIGIIIYTCVADGLPPTSELNLVAQWGRLPLFFGTVVYCFEAISMTMPLKNEMKVPHQFSSPLGVLHVGSGVISLLLIGLGSVSYMKFGENITGAVTLNLDPKSILCQVITLSMCLGLLFTYPIQLYVPVDVMWPMVSRRVRRLPLLRAVRSPVVPELAFRSSLVFLTFLAAECVPRLGLLISLVGSMSGSTLAFIIPPLLDWSWRPQVGMSLARHIGNASILLFGVLMSGWGTYTAAEQIVEAFMSGDLNVT